LPPEPGRFALRQLLLVESGGMPAMHLVSVHGEVRYLLNRLVGLPVIPPPMMTMSAFDGSVACLL